MAMRFFRILFVCAVIYSISPVKSGAQLSIASASGVREIPHSVDVKDPEDQVVLKGASATLRCVVKSLTQGVGLQVKPEITWLHNGEPVPKNDSKRTVQKDGSLYVSRVKKPLTGAYRCRVKTGVGVLISGEAKLQTVSLDMDVTDEKISVEEYQPVILPCQPHFVPEAKVKWEYKRQNLPHNIRYVPLPSGALLILKTLRDDAGVYRCIATNSVSKKSKPKIVTLTVLSSFADDKSVSFLPIPVALNTTVTLGTRTSLFCPVKGWPLPKIEWIRDGVTISNSTILNIPVARQSSIGRYVCRAANSVSSATQDYHLNVRQKPFFSVGPRSKSYKSPGLVGLKCEAGGYPEPCIEWFKDGELLKLGGRIWRNRTDLTMIHTFTYDAGIYQCVASNSAGTSWTSAEVVLNAFSPPPPPLDVACRPYDDKSVCVTWRKPDNVTAHAFSIHSFFRNPKECYEGRCNGTNNIIGCDDGSHEESGPDFVTDKNYYLANRLNKSTNYTFYVRLYSIYASDDSSKASCISGIEGSRELKYKILGRNIIELIWSEVSSDVPCGSSNTTYIVQWKREDDTEVKAYYVQDLKYTISGLNPSSKYQFRVMSSTYKNEDTPWVLLEIPLFTADSDQGTPKVNYTHFDNETISQNAPTNPEDFRALEVKPRSIVLTWRGPGAQPTFYNICYVEILEDDEEADNQQKCEDGNGQSNPREIGNLKPNTLYEFRIRAHNSEGLYALFSSPIKIRTHPDVPSEVLDLKYRIINESAACLGWLPPKFTSGKLLKYIVTYTPDRNRPFEDWTLVEIPIGQISNFSCWTGGDKNTVSVTLVNLKISKEYTVIVRAASETGLGNPLLLKTISKSQFHLPKDMENDTASKQKMGVIVGCILALVCIICCVSCLILRRRCVKRRNVTRERAAATNNHFPAMAHYASRGSSMQTVKENTCSADLAETESLVSGEITEVAPNHLDSKGRDAIPNGNLNGLKKPSVNGNLLNGHVHITQNPQFDKEEKVSDNLRKQPHYYPAFHEQDPNCNRIRTPKHKHNYLVDVSPTKKRHPHVCFPLSETGSAVGRGLFNGSAHHRRYYDDEDDDDYDSFSYPSCENNDLETTQLTCLDDSYVIGNHRRISPTLEPNG